jgi:hypothetical protein
MSDSRIEFNFTGLHPVFSEAVKRQELSIAFPLIEGNGRFVFLIFLETTEDGDILWNDLMLFIFLSRTQTMLDFKLLGNHLKAGDFKIRLTTGDEEAIRRELDLRPSGGGPAFVLTNFLQKLNASIPASLSLEDKVTTLQQENKAIHSHCAKYMEDPTQKIYLLGTSTLPFPKKPREETLRKLYTLKARPSAIATLIEHLKRLRWTVCWTATEPKGDRFEEVFGKVAARMKAQASKVADEIG